MVSNIFLRHSHYHHGYLLKEGQTRYIALRGGDTAGHTLTVPGINMLGLLNI